MAVLLKGHALLLVQREVGMGRLGKELLVAELCWPSRYLR